MYFQYLFGTSSGNFKEFRNKDCFINQFFNNVVLETVGEIVYDKGAVQEYSGCAYEAALERVKLKKEKAASNVISRFTKDYIPPFKANTTNLGNGIKKINYSPLRVKIED